jgi:hypothetical protein
MTSTHSAVYEKLKSEREHCDAGGKSRTRQLELHALGEKSQQTAASTTSRKTAGAQSQNLSSTKKISQDNPAADKKQEPSGTRKIKTEAATERNKENKNGGSDGQSQARTSVAAPKRSSKKRSTGLKPTSAQD